MIADRLSNIRKPGVEVVMLADARRVEALSCASLNLNTVIWCSQTASAFIAQICFHCWKQQSAILFSSADIQKPFPTVGWSPRYTHARGKREHSPVSRKKLQIVRAVTSSATEAQIWDAIYVLLVNAVCIICQSVHSSLHLWARILV